MDATHVPRYGFVHLLHLSDLKSISMTNIRIYYRLDISMGGHSRPRNPLLPTQDRLPRDLETAERGAYHPFQCCTDCKHLALQRERSRETASACPRHGGSEPTHAPSLRAND